MSNIWVILGAGNLIRDLQDAITSNGDLLRCVVINQPLEDSLIKKIKTPIIDIKDYRPSYRDQHLFGFLNPKKEKFIEILAEYSLTYGNLIHPKAYLASDVQLGYGNYMGPMTVIAPNAALGNFNYINRGASIGHDTVIKDFNHLGPSAVVCGNCNIGNRNYFGANSVVIDNIALQDEITIGAGGVVRTNIFNPGIYVGVPVHLKS